jgi:acyl carrier protein
MKEQVIDILTNFGIKPSELTGNVHFTRDLGLDSLDTVDLIMQLEQTFGIRIPDEDYPKLLTLNGVLTYLEEEQQVGVAA